MILNINFMLSTPALHVEMKCFPALLIQEYQTIVNLYTGLFKNPGFSPKTQPSGFNWFKPGLTGFYGLNWVKLRIPLTMPQFWLN